MGEEGTIGRISKGPIHRKIDATVNDRTKRRPFLDAIEAAPDLQTYLNILQNQAGVTPQQIAYLQLTWYGQAPPNVWWPTLQPIFPIIQLGLVRAIWEAMVGDRDLDSYWAPSDNPAPTAVEVSILGGLRQVTRIIHTPASPAPQPLARPNTADIWIVKESVPGMSQKGNQTAEERVVDVDGNLVITRRKEF